MELPFKITNPIASFDTETTSKDPSTARIVSISILKIHPSGHHELKAMILDPTIPIPKEASDIHHITDEKIAELKAIGKAPTFAKVAHLILEFIKGCDVLCYNCGYDVVLLCEEFNRIGITEWPHEGMMQFDPMVIFKKKEERTLSAASLFYLNETLEGAHGSTADTLAATKVFFAQIKRYDELSTMTAEEVAAFCKMADVVDLAGKMAYREDGKIIFTFGKYKDKLAYDALSDKRYYNWLMEADGFTSNTRNHFKRLHDLIPKK